MYAIYIYIYGNLVTWIPSIYPLYVSINIAAPAGSVMGTVKFTSSVAAKKNPPHPTTSHDASPSNFFPELPWLPTGKAMVLGDEATKLEIEVEGLEFVN